MTNPMTPSRLILHADDLGLNRAVSEGVLRGFREGLLTSTSLLANAPCAQWALQQWKGLLAERAAGSLPSAATREKLHDSDQPFDLGAHLNLTQGRPLSGSRYPPELLDRVGRFPGVLSLFFRLRRHGNKFHAAIRAELERQLQVLCDHGLQPTHLNGHQYIEMIPAVSEVVPELLAKFAIKSVRVAREGSLLQSTVLRGQIGKWPLAAVKRVFAERFRARIDALGVAHADAFFGTAHAGGVDLRLLRRFLASATEDRLMEIGLHPGEASDGELPAERADGWHDPLACSRPDELRMLLSAELPACLEAAGRLLARLSP
jgi:chitin disaccharide deacetylase